MRLFSYVVARDYGFAPNPFLGICTLATCKPRIRKTARRGDLIIGTGSKARGRQGHLVFAMRVSETLTYNEYWFDERFLRKRPNLQGQFEAGLLVIIFISKAGTVSGTSRIHITVTQTAVQTCITFAMTPRRTECFSALTTHTGAVMGHVSIRSFETMMVTTSVPGVTIRATSLPILFGKSMHGCMHSVSGGYLGEPLDWPQI